MSSESLTQLRNLDPKLVLKQDHPRCTQGREGRAAHHGTELLCLYSSYLVPGNIQLRPGILRAHTDYCTLVSIRLFQKMQEASVSSSLSLAVHWRYISSLLPFEARILYSRGLNVILQGHASGLSMEFPSPTKYKTAKDLFLPYFFLFQTNLPCLVPPQGTHNARPAAWC